MLFPHYHPENTEDIRHIPDYGAIRRQAHRDFKTDEPRSRSELLGILGDYLDLDKREDFRTIGELRKFIKGKGKIFPNNAGSYRILTPMTHAVILEGIDYFEDKEKIKRKGKRKSKLDYCIIVERANRGESISKIAEDAEISRSRVRQIVKSQW